MTTFDRNKPYQTRDGRKARIVADDVYTISHGSGSILALVKGLDGYERTCLYFTTGRVYAGHNSSSDLVNVPEKKTLWVNCYPHDTATGHPTREKADRFAGTTREACVEFTYTVGEGL